MIINIFFLSSCAKDSSEEVFAQENYVFGTRIEIRVADRDHARAAQVVRAIFLEFDAWHRRYHAWQVDSELAKMNRALAAKQTVELTPDTAEILQTALEFGRLSDGLFHVGLGRAVALWGFHSDEFAPSLPDEQALNALKSAHLSLNGLHLDGQRLRVDSEQWAFDLGGMLKGWALDRAAAQLRAAGFEHALINLGGNILAMGTRFGEAWRVGIAHARQSGALAILELHDGEAIGTSGDYQRFFEVNGQRFCHLIDPRTFSARCPRRAATVLVSGRAAGLRSDVASKPIFFAEAAARSKFVQRFGLSGVLLQELDGQILVSESLAKRLTWTNNSEAITMLPDMASSMEYER